jgi:hypothetical protein
MTIGECLPEAERWSIIKAINTRKVAHRNG